MNEIEYHFITIHKGRTRYRRFGPITSTVHFACKVLVIGPKRRNDKEYGPVKSTLNYTLYRAETAQ